MKNRGKIKTILVLAVALCFAVVLVVLTGATTPPVGKKEPKAKKVKTDPIWQIIQEGTAKSVMWVDHEPNPRFAIYDPGTPSDNSDDLVLDKETGLVWARNANLAGEQIGWMGAIDFCRACTLGHRKGWRLPTLEELSSLVDPSQELPSLPSGHPFINVQLYDYWSSNTYEYYSTAAWLVNMNNGIESNHYKSDWDSYVWPVRGGNGYATGSW